MPRLLPVVTLLLLSATVSFAQHTPDTLRLPPVMVNALYVQYKPMLGCLGGGTNYTFSHVSDSAVTIKEQLTELREWHVPAFTTIQPILTRIAGVQITPYSGAPGASSVVRIRGAANLAAVVHPLYVVDGVPQFARLDEQYGASPAGQLADLNPLLSIPPEEIESVEVLKGAYETALYGQQGTDGVIRITTRRGRQPGKPRLQYRGYGGVQTSRYRYDLLNAREYALLANELADAYQRPLPYSAAQVAGFGQGTDWQSEILRPAVLHSHHLSLQGRRDSTSYYAAANYLNQQGIVDNSYLKRYGLRTTVTQDLGGRLHLEAGGSFQQLQQQYSPYAASNALRFRPTEPIRDANGEFPELSPLYGSNPVQLVEQQYQHLQQTTALARVRALWRLGGGLALDVPVALELTRQQQDNYISPLPSTPAGKLSEQENRYKQLAILPTLRYGHTWANQQLRASVGVQAQDFRYESETPSQSPFPGSSGFTLQSSLRAAQATTQYTLAERYEALATLRYDGNSQFAPYSRWEWQPGVQLRWHVGQESFLKQSGRVKMLDVWAGWSRVRSKDIASFSYSLLGGSNSLQSYLQQQHHLDAGLRIVVGSFDVTLEAYRRRTTLARLGFTNIQPTDMQVLNHGLELSVARDWQWGALAATTHFAGSLNRNRFRGSEFLFPFPKSSALFDGQPLAGWRGATYLGVNPANGQARYQDADGNGFPDLGYQGSGLPRQLLSLSQQLSYHRFSLELQADAMLGYTVNNRDLATLDMVSRFSNSSGRLRNRWTPTNPVTEVPGVIVGPSTLEVSTYTLQSGNHLRLTNLTARYTLWEHDSRSLSLWVGAQDLLVFSHYRGSDPNVSNAGADARQAGLDSNNYPIARTILLGVQATL